MVEIQGLEPWTSCMPCKRSSQLSYIPLRLKQFYLNRGKKESPEALKDPLFAGYDYDNAN